MQLISQEARTLTRTISGDELREGLLSGSVWQLFYFWLHSPQAILGHARLLLYKLKPHEFTVVVVVYVLMPPAFLLLYMLTNPVVLENVCC